MVFFFHHEAISLSQPKTDWNKDQLLHYLQSWPILVDFFFLHLFFKLLRVFFNNQSIKTRFDCIEILSALLNFALGFAMWHVNQSSKTKNLFYIFFVKELFLKKKVLGLDFQISPGIIVTYILLILNHYLLHSHLWMPRG